MPSFSEIGDKKILTSLDDKLFYMEISLEKATYTGHVAHKKKQVILHGNSFRKGYVHWTRSTQKKRQVILHGNSFGKGYVHWTRRDEQGREV